MAEFKNTEGLTTSEIKRHLEQGGKFVIYEYCISIIVMSFKQGSDIYFIKAGESGINKGLKFTFLTVLLGWWGIPWGPIYSIGALYTNLRGGKNVTQEVLSSFSTQTQEA